MFSCVAGASGFKAQQFKNQNESPDCLFLFDSDSFEDIAVQNLNTTFFEGPRKFTLHSGLKGYKKMSEAVHHQTIKITMARSNPAEDDPFEHV